MTKLQGQNDLEVATAKIALLALTVQHGGNKSIQKYRMGLGATRSGLLEEEEAAAWLAHAVKPLACSSRIEGSTLEVSCQPVSGKKHLQNRHSYLIGRLKERKGVVGEILNRLTPTERDSAMVEIRGDSRTLLVAISALEAWTQDYLIDGEFGMSADPLRPGDPAEGMAVVRFGAVREVSLEDLFRVVRDLN